jgi:hypothetical protein
MALPLFAGSEPPARRVRQRSPHAARLLARVVVLGGLLGGGGVACAAGSAAGRLAWAPPKLAHPLTVHVGAPGVLRLDPARDYRIVLPAHRPVTGPGGLTVSGGHDVVLVGGEIDIPRLAPSASGDARRGLYLENQTGTVHVEGLEISGADLSEGIDLSEPLGAVVELENVRVERLRAHDEVGWTDNHPDVVQTWSGPAVLRIDGLTGITDYQGLFLAPNQFAPEIPMRELDLRRVNLISTHRCTCVLLWNSSPFPQVSSDSVWVEPTRGRSLAGVLWPARSAWPGVQLGLPAGGSFVPPGAAGLGYRSPGYSSARR